MNDSLNETVKSKMGERNDRLALIVYWSLATVAVGLGVSIPDVQVIPALIDNRAISPALIGYLGALIVQMLLTVAFAVFVGWLALAHRRGCGPTTCSPQAAKKHLSVRDIFFAIAVCAAVITAMDNASWELLGLLFYSIAWMMVIQCIAFGSKVERAGAIVLIICQIASGLSSFTYGWSSGTSSMNARDVLSYLFCFKPMIYPCSVFMWLTEFPSQELVNVCTMFSAFELMIGVLLIRRGVKRSMAFAALVLLVSFASQFRL